MTDSDSEFRREFRCQWCDLEREDCACQSPEFVEYGKCGSCGLWKPVPELYEADQPGAVTYETCNSCHCSGEFA